MLSVPSTCTSNDNKVQSIKLCKHWVEKNIKYMTDSSKDSETDILQVSQTTSTVGGQEGKKPRQVGMFLPSETEQCWQIFCLTLLQF